MKRIIIFILSTLLVLSLVSCSFIKINKKEIPDPLSTSIPDHTDIPDDIEIVVTDIESKKAQAKSYLNSLPDYDFGGKSFTIATATGYTFVPEINDTLYNAALIERNSMVASKYNTYIVQYDSDLDVMLSESYSNHLSGLFYADMMAIPMSALGTFAAKGYLMNLNSLPFIDYNKPYFDQEAMKQASAGYMTYAAIGDFNKDIGSFYCLYFNRTLFNQLGIEIPYESVKNGTWTWDKLIEILNQASTINDSVDLIGADSDSTLINVVYKSSGLAYTNTGVGQVPSAAFNTPPASSVLDILRSLIEGNKTFYNSSSQNQSSQIDFMNGNMLFFTGSINDMKNITNMLSDWCILPIPKVDPNQEKYVSYCSNSFPVIVSLASNPDVENTSYALAALNAASYYLNYSYYEYLTDNSIRDSSTLDMLDYISGIKNGSFSLDFTQMFGNEYPYILKNTQSAFASVVYNRKLSLDNVCNSSQNDLGWRLANIFPIINE